MALRMTDGEFLSQLRKPLWYAVSSEFRAPESFADKHGEHRSLLEQYPYCEDDVQPRKCPANCRVRKDKLYEKQYDQDGRFADGNAKIA